MPAPIKRRFIMALIPAALCACGSIQPHGPLKSVVEGKIFEGTPRNPEEEKREEESRRRLDHQAPALKEEQGVVQFRIPF